MLLDQKIAFVEQNGENAQPEKEVHHAYIMKHAAPWLPKAV